LGGGGIPVHNVEGGILVQYVEGIPVQYVEGIPVQYVEGIPVQYVEGMLTIHEAAGVS